MDYWTLLCKYTRHIAELEGIDYTDKASLDWSDVKFTEGEVAALQRASDEGKQQ